jgi:hypothetical protein
MAETILSVNLTEMPEVVITARKWCSESRIKYTTVSVESHRSNGLRIEAAYNLTFHINRSLEIREWAGRKIL